MTSGGRSGLSSSRDASRALERPRLEGALMYRPIVALGLLALLLIAVIAVTTSADVTPFDARAFAEAQAAGRSVVVAVNANW